MSLSFRPFGTHQVTQAEFKNYVLKLSSCSLCKVASKIVKLLAKPLYRLASTAFFSEIPLNPEHVSLK